MKIKNGVENVASSLNRRAQKNTAKEKGGKEDDVPQEGVEKGKADAALYKNMNYGGKKKG